MTKTKTSRRTLLRNTIGAAAVIPLGSIPLLLRADQHQLDESDPAAQALGYKHDTAEVDAARYPKHAPDQACKNCQLYQPTDAEDWGGCAIFPGKQVNAQGWCSAWVARQG